MEQDTNLEGNLKFRESVRVPLLRRAILTLLFISLMMRPIYAGGVGDPAYLVGVRLPENLEDVVVEDFDAGKEALTFVVFQISITEFRKWARDCGIFWYLEVLRDPIQVTELVKNEKKSRYYKKEIYVKHGYLFTWESENYLGSIIYDLTNSTVYVEALRMK
jgi:hypothetical protein